MACMACVLHAGTMHIPFVSQTADSSSSCRMPMQPACGTCFADIALLRRCGDSCAPGIGVPAAAASGMITANTLAPVWKHLQLLDSLVL